MNTLVLISLVFWIIYSLFINIAFA